MLRSTTIRSAAQMSDYINWELLAMANAQSDFVCQGVLLRGAICVGQLYIDDSTVFGPALVQAYSLESATAVFPRIIIDADVMRRARYEATLSIWRDYVTRGEDGPYFIDYLFGSYVDRWSYPAEDAMSAEELLMAHKAAIEARLEQSVDEHDYRKKQKTIWLAQYHNSSVKRLRERLRDSVPSSHFSDTEISESLFEF